MTIFPFKYSTVKFRTKQIHHKNSPHAKHAIVRALNRRHFETTNTTSWLFYNLRKSKEWGVTFTKGTVVSSMIFISLKSKFFSQYSVSHKCQM